MCRSCVYPAVEFHFCRNHRPGRLSVRPLDRQAQFTLTALHGANSLSQVVRDLLPSAENFQWCRIFGSNYRQNVEDSQLDLPVSWRILLCYSNPSERQWRLGAFVISTARSRIFCDRSIISLASAFCCAALRNHSLHFAAKSTLGSGKGILARAIIGLLSRIESIAQETDAQAGTAERCEVDQCNPMPKRNT